MLVIGLISGTSVDGIDAALVEISNAPGLTVNLLAGTTYSYPAALRDRILEVCGGAPLSMAELAELDDAIAHQFAAAAIAIQTGHSPADLIGSHGQTVYHRPPEKDKGEKINDKSPSLSFILHPSSFQLGYSLQLGRGALIAHFTRITTISNFRAADIAAGGQGAPMVPPVDVALLSHPSYNRCVQNIGGIGNVAYLPAARQVSGVGFQVSGEDTEAWRYGDAKDVILKSPISSLQSPVKIPPPDSHPPRSILGWDTGPGNVLIDLAVEHLSGGTKTYDKDGAWAASGTPDVELVNRWLQQDFFRQRPPKSTGRELFSPVYLEQCLQDAGDRSLTAADLLATLTELTAASIADSYHRFLPQLPDQVLLCGGGSKNLYLRQRLQAHLVGSSVLTTDEVGLSADFKEAIAFAVLAYWRYQEIPGNLPEVTGAERTVLLGEIHQVS
jgi:anhydro-N-acetylmuramic acid kinase